MSVASCSRRVDKHQRRDNNSEHIDQDDKKLYNAMILMILIIRRVFRLFSRHHLRIIFELFTRLEISINLKKVFLDYANVNLLRQRVNFLELYTSKKKLKIISSYIFFSDLTALKH